MLTSIELCAGAGGQALGLEQAGFAHRLLLENDTDACASLRINRPKWNVIEADIRRMDASYWKGIDLLAGGLPCPPFSIAGQQLGEQDDRDLFSALMRLIDQTQPRAVLVENVRGLLSSRFANYRALLDEKLHLRGFDPYWSMFNAVDFGVPQSRYRVFLITLRRGDTKALEWPINDTQPPKTVAEATADLMAENDWQGMDAWIGRASQPAPTIVGGSKKHGGPHLGPTRARQQWAALGIDGKGIANLAPERDFQGMPRLTNRMVARLQAFPDEWQFFGNKTSVYRQIGNALPVQLATAVGRSVRKCLI